ncbi:hypothetical protein [Thermoflexus sp.]|uniref:hypothetical protein n=1 Tax=Thermoflexus sp. TaxID=1969742 RepID=UPI0035E43EFD
MMVRLAGSPARSPARGIQARWGWVALFMLIFAFYIPVLSVGFFSDDLLFSAITSRDPLDLFQGVQGLLHYRPLSMLLFWSMQRWFGYSRAAFHFLTLSLHMLNTALLYPILRRLGASRFISRSASVLFGLLPFAHEPIAFLMGSVHSLSLLWLLVATVLILRPGPQTTWRRILLALGAYLAAILSHETGIVWPAWLLGIAGIHRGRFPALRLVIPLSFAAGIAYFLLWRTLPRGDPGVLALPIFTLESSLYAMQGWLYPLGPLLGGLWDSLFGSRPILLRGLRPEDWAFLTLGFGITIGMLLGARPRWTVPVGLWGFVLSITPALLFWGPASGMMNYPRMLLIPGIWSVLAWSGVLGGIRRQGTWGSILAGGILGSTLTLSGLFLVSSLGYYQDATVILQGMAQAAREAGERPLLFVNLPYNVGYRWFRARYYPYHYGGAGAVLITDDRQLAWYIRINGGPDLTDRPREWVRSARMDALYPNWFTPASPMGFSELREALTERAVYVFQEDLSWIPLHRIWQVNGTPDEGTIREQGFNPLDPAPRFDGRIVLRGWQVETRTGELLLLWEAQATPGRRWQVFVHLLDPEGRLIGQADGPMAGGLAPTDAWRRGDRVIDRHPLPVGIRPAAFRVGLYDLNSGERAVVEWEGELPADRSVLLPAAIGP